MSISRALILTDNDDPYPLAGDSSGEDLANFRRVSAQHVKVGRRPLRATTCF